MAQNSDLQQLQNLCVDIVNANVHTQNILMFVGVNVLLFLLTVFFARIITSNKEYAFAFYRSAYNYYIQVFTIVTIVPLFVYLYEDLFNFAVKLLVTLGLLCIIFLLYEFWPHAKKEAIAHNGIVSTVLMSFFAINYYFTIVLAMRNEDFTDTVLALILVLYLMVLNVFIRLIKEVKHINT
jgi:hypothetical protein